MKILLILALSALSIGILASLPPLNEIDGELEPLKEETLAGRLGADEHREPGRRLEVERLVVAEVPQFEPCDAHKPFRPF